MFACFSFSLTSCASEIYTARGHMKSRFAAILALVLGIVMTLSVQWLSAQSREPQPEMKSALEHLREAQQDLNSGSHDKGGHRVKAIEYVNNAINEVDQAIRYDNTHGGDQYHH